MLHCVDRYTPNDPVSEGRIVDSHPPADPNEHPWFSSRPIRNRDSVAYDHTSYWENTQQFVSEVVCDLAALTPHGALGHLADKGEREILATYADQAHPRAVDALSWSNLASLLDTVLLLWALWDPALVGIGRVVQGAFDKLAGALPIPFEENIRAIAVEGGEAVTRVLAILLVVLLRLGYHRLLTVAVWESWYRERTRAMLLRPADVSWRAKFPAVLFWLFTFAPLVLVAVGWFAGWWG